MDAQDLALKRNATGNILASDTIHHLRRPLEFLRRAVAALKPGGRLVICEPAISLWSRLVYGSFHHEPLDLNCDVFALDSFPPVDDPGHTFANMAIPELLFFSGRQRTLGLLPSAQMIVARKLAFLLYPLSGGFSYRCVIPLKGLPILRKIEDIATKVLPESLIGMRMLVVLEKTASVGSPTTLPTTE
jgi:SAM-dependent methyltransferase